MPFVIFETIRGWILCFSREQFNSVVLKFNTCIFFLYTVPLCDMYNHLYDATEASFDAVTGLRKWLISMI